jgi:hypothetical protein
LKSPIEFSKNIELRRYVALFYEDVEYAKTITFEFLKTGVENKEHSFYIYSIGGDKDFLETEFKESIYGPTWRYNYDFIFSMKGS